MTMERKPRPHARAIARVSFAVVALAAVAPAHPCNVDAAPMSFGSVNPLDDVDTDSVATLTVTCPAETEFSAVANAGEGTYLERSMVSGGNRLAYQLYVDASHTLVWGDGTGGTSVIADSAGATGTTRNVFGRLPAQPLAVPGTYVDTLVVTITY